MLESNTKQLAKTMLSNGIRPTRLYRPKGRSRITNGRSLLRNVDGRSFWCRRLRDLQALLVSDLGGDDAISSAEHAIIRRACVLQVECERREAKFAEAGEASDQQIEVYQRVSNSLRRLLESVGLQRRARDVTPDLGTYLREKGYAQ
jgi:hypothetical protein